MASQVGEIMSSRVIKATVYSTWPGEVVDQAVTRGLKISSGPLKRLLLLVYGQNNATIEAQPMEHAARYSGQQAVRAQVMAEQAHEPDLVPTT